MLQTQWIIWSNEHQAYWGPNNSGYRRKIENAGRYTYEEARAICFPGRGRAHRALEPIGDGGWPPPELMFPDPLPHAASLPDDMEKHFGRELR